MQIMSDKPSVSIKEARSILSKFKRHGVGAISPQELRAVEAAFFGYQRVRYTSDWEIIVPLPARKLLRVAATLARSEGMINHALSLEARGLRLPKNCIYRAGRLKNGCAMAHVVVGR